MRNMNSMIVMLTLLVYSGLAQARDNMDLALQHLRDPDSNVRCEAAETLGQSASRGDNVIEALRRCLSDANHDVRRAAIRALYHLGPEAVDKAGLLQHTGYDPIDSVEAVALLDKAWDLFNAEYPMFVMRKDLDWDALRRRYRAQAETAQSGQEAAIVLTQMLSHLRDGHVWVSHKGKKLPVFRALAEVNVNKNTKIYASDALLGQIRSAGRRLMWAKTKDNIGWIMFPRWDGADLPAQFDEVMEQMRDTRGLIVDVRWNGGGDAELSKYVATRFVDTERVYSHYRYRKGPQRTDLTAKIEQTISPRGPWRYDRPVVLLMGQGCVSACESFCAMMAACPNVTTMGDHTRGSTGFPVPFQLGHEIEIYIPQWLVTLPDGQVVDGQGVQPDVPFMPKADSFTDDRDELLTRVLERLRGKPLPAQAIAGPTPQAVRAREAADRDYRPRIVFVEPRDGMDRIAPDTALRVRFDRPMHPSTLQLEWEEGGFRECHPIRYDESKYEFTIPICLEAGCQQRIVINPAVESAEVKGFQSVHGTASESTAWTFSTRAAVRKDRTCASGPNGRSDPDKTRSVVEQYNRTRNALWAFVETIKTQEHTQHGPHGYRRLRAYTTQFTVNGERGVRADVGDRVGGSLVVFREGHVNHISGYYRKTSDAEEILFCLDADVTDTRVVVADPFHARNSNIDTTLRRLKLQYRGQDVVDGKACDIVCIPNSGNATLPERQWWVDRQSRLLAKMVIRRDNGTKLTCRFAYAHLNEPLHYMAYMPDVSYQWVCEHKKMAEPVKDGDRGCFLELCDGTRETVCSAWGRYDGKTKNAVGIDGHSDTLQVSKANH